jgi:hypothetical protein
MSTPAKRLDTFDGATLGDGQVDQPFSSDMVGGQNSKPSVTPAAKRPDHANPTDVLQSGSAKSGDQNHPEARNKPARLWVSGLIKWVVAGLTFVFGSRGAYEIAPWIPSALNFALGVMIAWLATRGFNQWWQDTADYRNYVRAINEQLTIAERVTLNAFALLLLGGMVWGLVYQWNHPDSPWLRWN